MKKETILLIIGVAVLGILMYKFSKPSPPTDLAGIMQYFGYDESRAREYMTYNNLPIK